MGCPNVAVVLRIDGDSNRNLRHGPCTIDGVKPQFSKTALISSRDAFTISPNRYNVQPYAYIPTQVGAGISCRNCHRQAPRLLPSAMTTLSSTFFVGQPFGRPFESGDLWAPCCRSGGRSYLAGNREEPRVRQRRTTFGEVTKGGKLSLGGSLSRTIMIIVVYTCSIQTASPPCPLPSQGSY